MLFKHYISEHKLPHGSETVILIVYTCEWINAFSVEDPGIKLQFQWNICTSGKAVADTGRAVLNLQIKPSAAW